MLRFGTLIQCRLHRHSAEMRLRAQFDPCSRRSILQSRSGKLPNRNLESLVSRMVRSKSFFALWIWRGSSTGPRCTTSPNQRRSRSALRKAEPRSLNETPSFATGSFNTVDNRLTLKASFALPMPNDRKCNGKSLRCLRPLGHDLAFVSNCADPTVSEVAFILYPRLPEAS